MTLPSAPGPLASGPPLPREDDAWLPPATNHGHAYHDRLSTACGSVVAFYSDRYRHSEAQVWRERLAAGEILCNGRQLRADGPLQPGDRLVWHRPPWQEAAVPVLPEHAIVLDDGDLLVLNKPSGLPVLPAGGFLEHTVLHQLQHWLATGVLPADGGLPRPVHRLGRFTSGLLVCARRPASRAWLSAQLRESTAAVHTATGPGATPSSEGPAGRAVPQEPATAPCRKLYRALTAPLPADWGVLEQRLITTAIGRQPHPLLGQIWCAVAADAAGALPCASALQLLERREEACLVEVAIATGRPHQIRIHCAALGAPLLGDPLYRPDGSARDEALPGAGGYHLHAHRLQLSPPGQEPLQLEAPLPRKLQTTP